MEDLEMAKLVFEKAKIFLEKAQNENDISDYEKCLSEIELAMDRCEIKSLYKVVEIKGKGKGCIALEDIEIGTLILKEKPQCIPEIRAMDVNSGLHSYDDHLCSLMDSFFSMDKNVQEEYLTLYNKYLDPRLQFDLYPQWERFAQLHEKKWISNAQFHVDRHFILKIICIFYTNSFAT